jgi:ATP-dependent protease ClpP protease subunit
MAIKIKGVIGADIDGQEFAERISRLSGDIEFEIDSPGGSVFHGISMYNAIKNYDRGKCRMHVVGDCSSMAAYVMLAGDGDVEFEPNSIVVLHNPWSFAIGDYKAMQKEANILEELAKLYAKAFVERGLFKEAEIRSIMDEETWFMGENLKKLGVVLGEENDSNSSEEDEETEGSKEIKIAAFRERMNEAKAKLKAMKDGDETEKIAALLSKNKQANTNKEYKNVIEPQEKGENEMVKSLEELKAQNSAVYNEAIDEGKKAEQKRVASLMKFIDVDKNAVIKAINDGVGVNDDEFQASILMAKTSKKQIAEMEEENPEEVNPETETHAPEGEGEGEELTEEQKAEAQKKADDEKFNALIEAMGIK